MERAAILGVYDYIGYGLCKHLLDRGIEIEGIDLSNKSKDYYAEEKRMEIGRNANFIEVPYKEWNCSSGAEVAFVSLFEYFQDQKSRFGDEMLFQLPGSLENMRTVLILPAYLAKQNTDKRFHENKINDVTEIYLPTIYGPWQPEDFFFQRVLNSLENGGGIPEAEKWEWTADAIYIDDAIRSIVNLAESEQPGRFLLSSGTEERWQKCVEELLGKSAIKYRGAFSGVHELRESIKMWKIDGNEDISKGLFKQKEQYSRILESRV